MTWCAISVRPEPQGGALALKDVEFEYESDGSVQTMGPYRVTVEQGESCAVVGKAS
jgi:ABC-type transport system involved in cytochrome bd biosynthesis fused ATPase/permease subunit